MEVANAIAKETVDLESIPVEEVLEQLKCTREGLTSEAAQQRIRVFGYNKLEEKQESKLLKFLGFMWNPLSWVMEIAAIMAIALAHEEELPGEKVLRDGTWSELDASLLVPGDIISVKLGDIIPADAHLLEGDPLKIDQVFLAAQPSPLHLGMSHNSAQKNNSGPRICSNNNTTMDHLICSLHLLVNHYL